jgi:hypothetical protein
MPAATITGRFEWKNSELLKYVVREIRIRLDHPVGSVAFWGGRLNLLDGNSLIITSTGELDCSVASCIGHVELHTFGTQLLGARSDFSGGALSGQLASSLSEPNRFDVDLASGVMVPVHASFSTDELVSDSAVTSGVFSDGSTARGVTALERVSIWVDKQVRVSANQLMIQKPELTIKTESPLEVVGAKEFVANHITAASQNPMALEFSSLKSTDSYVVPDTWAIINQLNIQSVFSPSVLLPTGDPNLRFVTVRDLKRLYEAIAMSEPQGRYVTSITVRQSGGIVTDISVKVEEVPKSAGHTPPDSSSNPFCFFVEDLADKASLKAVGSLLGMIVPSPYHFGLASALYFSDATNPRFVTTKFLVPFGVSKGVISFVKTNASDSVSAIPTHFCEVIVAALPMDIVFTNPGLRIDPVSFNAIEDSNNPQFAQELSTQYRAIFPSAYMKRTGPEGAFYMHVADQARILDSMKVELVGDISRARAAISTALEEDAATAATSRGEVEDGNTTSSASYVHALEVRAAQGKAIEQNKRLDSQQNSNRSQPGGVAPNLPDSGHPPSSPSSCDPSASACLNMQVPQ